MPVFPRPQLPVITAHEGAFSDDCTDSFFYLVRNVSMYLSFATPPLQLFDTRVDGLSLVTWGPMFETADGV